MVSHSKQYSVPLQDVLEESLKIITLLNFSPLVHLFNICVTNREVVIKHFYGTMTSVSRNHICANELQVNYTLFSWNTIIWQNNNRKTVVIQT